MLDVFSVNGQWVFSGPSPVATVENQGRVNPHPSRFVFGCLQHKNWRPHRSVFLALFEEELEEKG